MPRSRIGGSNIFCTFMMHRCLLVSEIFCNILEFTQQYEEPQNEKLGRQTIASLAQTCRALNPPALDQLWECLDNLDPLIKLLPRIVWWRPFCYTTTLIRILWMKKHRWPPFHQYAARVRRLRNSFRGDIHIWCLHIIVTALARSQKVILPLLPNLTELTWYNPDLTSDFAMALSLLKYFASPKLTHFSLRLPESSMLSYRPIKPAKLAALHNIPKLCPNVTSFSAIFQSYDSTLDLIAPYLSDIIRRWHHLQVFETSALSPPITVALASMPTVHMLKITPNPFSTHNDIGKVPATIQTLALAAYNTRECLCRLQTLQGNPVCFHLRMMHSHHSDEPEMCAVFQELSERLDVARLRVLTIELTTPCYSSEKSPSLLTEPLLASLCPFSALHTLDLSSFGASVLNDAAYARIVASWPELRCLKVGTTDAQKGRPVASVGAVIAVLRTCPHLQTLHIVFNGSIPPPCPMVSGEETGEELERERVERAEMDRGSKWGVSNAHITQIHVGHSPVGAGVDESKALATCLRSVMPQLRIIRFEREPSDVAERWQMVQHMLTTPATCLNQ